MGDEGCYKNLRNQDFLDTNGGEHTTVDQPMTTPICSVYDSVNIFVDFKVDMHHVYIKAREDLEQKWTTLPFITIDDVVFTVLDTWPSKWHAPNAVVHDEVEIQRQKAAAKFLTQ